MNVAKNIANNVIKRAPNGPDTTFGELWKEHRLAAREISALQPIFQTNNVKLIGVGLEELGVQEFINGKFFDGDLYIDTDKKSYGALGFQRFGFFGLFPAVLSAAARLAASRARRLGLGGNMKGDGYQNGGALVVEVGGTKTLLHFVQKEAPDHVNNADVLKALGIEGEAPTAESAAGVN